jgi:hypothetical protein
MANNQIQQQTTLQKLMHFTPKQSLSVEHAITQDQIGLLKKLDPQTTKDKIIQLLTRCTQLMNVQNNMNAMQIEFCAEQIMLDKYFYSLEDIQLCLDRGAIGAYGTIYNRIDPATILAWFPLYDQQRQPYVTAKRQAEEQANNIYEMFQHPQVMQAMNDVYDKMPHKEAPAQEVKREVNAFEQQLLSEYDALPEWVENKWFKIYNNKPYQFTEYRKERYMEEINKQNEY